MKNWNEETDELPDNHFWSTQEMFDAFAYLSEDKAKEIVIDNTHLIAGMKKLMVYCKNKEYNPSLGLRKKISVARICDERRQWK